MGKAKLANPMARRGERGRFQVAGDCRLGEPIAVRLDPALRRALMAIPPEDRVPLLREAISLAVVDYWAAAQPPEAKD